MFEELIWLTVGFLIGFLYALYRVAKHEVMEEMERRESEEPTIVDGTIEHHNGFFILYEENGTFVAQGKTYEELEQATNKRYPDKRFSVPVKQLNEIKLKSKLSSDSSSGD